MEGAESFVATYFPGAQVSSDGWCCKCPAHDDRVASLSVGVGTDGRVLLRCHAGCSAEAICGALGIGLRDLFVADNGNGSRAIAPTQKPAKSRHTFPDLQSAIDAAERGTGGKRHVATWSYENADGSESFHVARFEDPDGKTFRPIARMADGYTLGDPPGLLPLYHLPELAGAETVHVAEGEKAADSLRELGLTGTTSAHGSQSAEKSDWQPLAGKKVTIWPDRDEAGAKYAETVRRLLQTLEPAADVLIVEIPDPKDPGADVADLVDVRRQDGKEDESIRAELEHYVAQAHAERRKHERFPALTVQELESLPPPEWLLEGFLVGGSLATMYGQWGQGKSFIAQDIGLRTAAGLPWCGHATKQGVVLYVCGEGLPGINRRISAWLSQFETFPDVSRFYLCREMPRLLQREDRVAFLASLARLPEYPSLVILDTLARCLVGGEENSAKDMGVLMDACQAISDRTGGTVLLVHHTGKSGETIRGSSALPGAVDTLLEVSKSGDVVTVRTTKQKDSDAAPPISLKLVVVPLGYDGDFNEVSSCYPDPQKALDLSLWSRPDLGPTLGVLKTHFLDQGASFTDWHEAAGIAKSSFCLYRTFLVDNGYVRLEGKGRGAKYVLTDKGRSKVQLGPQ